MSKKKIDFAKIEDTQCIKCALRNVSKTNKCSIYHAIIKKEGTVVTLDFDKLFPNGRCKMFKSED